MLFKVVREANEREIMEVTKNITRLLNYDRSVCFSSSHLIREEAQNWHLSSVLTHLSQYLSEVE
jgi:hypothetical protein